VSAAFAPEKLQLALEGLPVKLIRLPLLAFLVFQSFDEGGLIPDQGMPDQWSGISGHLSQSRMSACKLQKQLGSA
jgi:hypothetical protein